MLAFQFWTDGGFASGSSANTVDGRTNVSGAGLVRPTIRILKVEAGAAELDELRPGRRADRDLRRRAGAVLELVVEDPVGRAERPDAGAGGIPRDADARHERMDAVRNAAADAGSPGNTSPAGASGLTRRLHARDEAVQAILDLRERIDPLVAKAVVQRDARRRRATRPARRRCRSTRGRRA